MMNNCACQRERYSNKGDGFWVCHHCGSLWTERMMGDDWLPLSCPDRQQPAPLRDGQ